MTIAELIIIIIQQLYYIEKDSRLRQQISKEIESIELKIPDELYTFKRTKIIKRGQVSSPDIANEINTLKTKLCIVNTRKHASY